MTTQANILVVDDTPANVRLLVELLTKHGYKVRTALSGKHALTVAQAEPLDLILLDILMPEMDGYAVCRQLKAQEATRDIPIIFLSALNETFNKVQAFECGGVDYITKPFQEEEVAVRVATHLSLRRMQQQLQAQNAQLHQEIAARQRVEDALREANATKDLFFSIIAHDLRSPFTTLLGYADLALQTLETASKETITDQISKIKTSAKAVFALLENLLTWSRLQRGIMDYQPRSLPLHAMIADLVPLFRIHAEPKQIALRQQIPATVYVYADANMLNTVIRNLFSNALKFTYPGGRIDITVQQRATAVEIAVADTGVGIAEDILPNLFRVDMKTTTTGTAGEKGTGLGLPLCKDLIEKNGGTIRVNSTPGQGATFVVTLPCPQESLQTGCTCAEHRRADGTAAALPAEADPLTCSWEESFAPPQMSHPPMPRETLAMALARLPQAWQSELREAAGSLNIAAVMNIIAQIRQNDESLAEALTTFAQQYQFDMLQEVCRSIESQRVQTLKSANMEILSC